MLRTLFALLLGLSLCAPVWGAIDVYEFSSEQARHRYQQFLEELRCPKCKNNNLAGTKSQIAVDLRRELYRMIEAGKTDEEIIDFMVSRYGDFVLYRPQFQPNTMALWLAPVAFLALGLSILGAIVWRRKRLVGNSETALDDREQEKLQRLLTEKSERSRNQ